MVLTRSSNQELDVPLWTNFSRPSFRWLDEMFRDGDGRQAFRVEVCNEGSSMVVRAEVPGVDPEKDIQVDIVNDALVISVEKTELHENNAKHVHRSEFRYGSLTRSVPIPNGVDESSIEATYKDGVLEVRMALPEGSSSEAVHRIPIKRV